ncbi:MAG: hypothetical protein LBQ32_04225 [Burkholderiaceae bacterium]|jgi:hypothetical protein|nr:hypothetical protein [Burkholderiaceae bacterium]
MTPARISRMAWLEHLSFTVRSVPMSAGTPFANVLLVAELSLARPVREAAA